jgi:hypothetical protein
MGTAREDYLTHINSKMQTIRAELETITIGLAIGAGLDEDINLVYNKLREAAQSVTEARQVLRKLPMQPTPEEAMDAHINQNTW